MAAMARSGALLLLTGLQAAVGTPIGGTIGEMVPTELPGPGFPGPTASASQMAWPVTHRQPGRFDAWPQLGYGTANRTLLPCWKRTALRDHADGWPGLCVKLMPAKKYATEEGCKALCWNEPRCAVWQFVNQTAPYECWVGWGENCAYREGAAVSVQAAQRIWHGSVRVLKNLSGWKINNLYNLGMYHTGDEHVSIMRCRSWCYTDIACQYWQYGPGGCWVDSPRFSAAEGNNINNRVQYPLTTDGGASKTSSDALTTMYGEYIQHYCPPQFSTPAPVLENPAPQYPLLMQTTGAPTASPSIAWWVWGLGGLAICLCGGVGAYAVMQNQGEEGPKKSGRSKRSGRVAMSDYSNEDSPLVTPPKSRYSPANDYQAPRPAPTEEYLNADQPQDYQQWPQQPQPPPPGRYGGGMPETQNLAGQRPVSMMHAPPETMTQQAMAPPTQPFDMMQSSQAMYASLGRQQYPQGGRPMGGMPFPTAGGQRPSMQGMQAPTARLM